MTESRKRVLLVCYYFPPLGLAGVGRPLHLFRDLPAHGWDCHVLTVKPVAYRAYEPELLEGLDTTRIHRAGSRDPQRLLYLLGIRKVSAATIERSRSASGRFFPDSKIGWVRPAVKLGRKLFDKHQYDAIVTTSPPISCHLIGQQLAGSTGVPWVADFRDFWTVYRIEDAYTDQDKIDAGRQLLRQIQTRAKTLSAVSEAIGSYVKASAVIPNGYDTVLAKQWKQPTNTDLFTIGILGHQYDKHEPRFLLRVLRRLIDEDPSVEEQLHIVQVGDVDVDWFESLFQSPRVNIAVTCHGRLSRRKTIDALLRAHLHYLDAANYDPEGFLPSRTFELMASGRAILACARPDGALGRVLEPYEHACCLSGEAVEDGARFLRAQLDAFRAGSLQSTPLSEYARQFSSTAMTEHFAHLLDSFA